MRSSEKDSAQTNAFIFLFLFHFSSYSMLKSEDAFIFDTGTEVFAWVGLRTSDAERKHSLKYAQDYLTKFNRPAYISVCR